MRENAYEKTINELYNLQFFGINLGLERIFSILEALGNPHKKLRIIHIAGTNGKGAVAAMIASILQEASYKTGLYISPHLVDFTERITINGAEISKGDVVALAEELRPIIKSIAETRSQPTFFEVVTAMAFLYFERAGVDFAVLETGLGGRLDATNVGNALVSVITSISLDHTDVLGKDVRSIAAEKAGIIHENGIVVTGAEGEALAVIKKTCMEKNALLHVVGEDITYECENDCKNKRDEWQQLCTIKGQYDEYYAISLPLIGAHQCKNAALAVGAIECLRLNDTIIGREEMRKGLEKTHWPGRVEIVQKKPLVILDGAHNLEAASALRNVLECHAREKKIHFVLGFMSDKKFEEIITLLAPLAKRIIATKADSPRALAAEKIAEIAEKKGVDVEVIPNVKDAYEKALSIADENDIVCVTGSFFVVGEVMALRVRESMKKGGVQ